MFKASLREKRQEEVALLKHAISTVSMSVGQSDWERLEAAPTSRAGQSRGLRDCVMDPEREAIEREGRRASMRLALFVIVIDSTVFTLARKSRDVRYWLFCTKSGPAIFVTLRRTCSWSTSMLADSPFNVSPPRTTEQLLDAKYWRSV